MLTKQQLTDKLTSWLEQFIKSSLNSEFELLDLLIPNTAISKLNNEIIKNLENYSAWDFTPDILGIVKDKSSQATRLIMINRYTSSISLRDIGTAYTIAKLTNAPLYFIISTKGVSNEVNILLINENIRERLLKINHGVKVKIGTYNEYTDSIDNNSWITSEGFGLID